MAENENDGNIRTALEYLHWAMEALFTSQEPTGNDEEIAKALEMADKEIKKIDAQQ